MASSRAVVAPYVNNDAFSRSIPNKIVDGFSTGRPVLTTLSGLTARILHEHQAGIGSESEDALFGELSRLMSDADYFEGVSLRARALYESQFSFDKIYGDLVDALTRLASAK
jgi:glycosyltransferase involved in cell wall biosynthesis